MALVSFFLSEFVILPRVSYGALGHLDSLPVSESAESTGPRRFLSAPLSSLTLKLLASRAVGTTLIVIGMAKMVLEVPRAAT